MVALLDACDMPVRAVPAGQRLAAGPQDLDIPGRGAHLEPGTAAVQLAFRRDALRARPFAALGAHVDVVEVGMDPVAVGKVDAGANGDGDVGCDVDDDIAG